jgi:hypothetical protein
MKKMVSLGKLFYYVIGYVVALKGGWLHVDPKRDEERPLSDPRIMGGIVEDATIDEVRRYVRVMGDRYREKSLRELDLPVETPDKEHK